MVAAHNTSSSNTAINTVKCGHSVVELGVPGSMAAGGIAPVQICISYNVGPTLVHLRRNTCSTGLH